MLTPNQRDLLAIELARLKIKTKIKELGNTQEIMKAYIEAFKHYRFRIEFFETEGEKNGQV